MESKSRWPLFSMGSFSAMLGLHFKSCKSCNYDNKGMDLPFQSRNVLEFSSPFAARSVCSKKFFILHIKSNFLLLLGDSSGTVLVMMFY